MHVMSLDASNLATSVQASWYWSISIIKRLLTAKKKKKKLYRKGTRQLAGKVLDNLEYV